MDYYDFKKVHRNFCKDYGYTFPNSNVSMRKALHKEYEASLMTAPIEDCAKTAKEFLMSTPLNQIVEDMKPFPLAPLPKAVPVKSGWFLSPKDCCIQEEGKTPMRTYNDTYASANAYVASPKSDAATQRDFLLEELARADYPKQKELQKVFNLYVDNTPKTYKEMIDIIKAGKYTIDPKIAKKVDAFDASDNGDDFSDSCYGPMHGIIWPGTVADWDGYHAAEVKKGKQYAIAKRVIMTGDAADGLKALQDFEAWLPTPPVTLQ